MSSRLHRRRWGAGPRTALLLHGSTSSSRTWWRVAPLLADRGWTVFALDLPSHGGSPAAGRALVPNVAADAVESELSEPQGGPDIGRVDVLAGHSFGAAVAVVLAARGTVSCSRLFLEELPGPRSVAWAQEAQAVVAGTAEARDRRDAVAARTREDQPLWTDEDCRYAVDDLASSHTDSITTGLGEGTTWLPRQTMRQIGVPVALLLAPDAPGINTLEDATALRGQDRADAEADLHATITVLDGGHCLHRDRPHEWVAAFTSAGSRDAMHDCGPDREDPLRRTEPTM